MSHSYGNGNSSGNNYLGRKRAEEDIQPYYYDKYDKYDKYPSHSNQRYNNSMNYNYSKPPPKMNNYYSSNSRYYNNYYSRSKPYYNQGYSSNLSQKRDHIRKPFQKYSAPGSTEGIRNLSHCDMPSTSPLSPNTRKDNDSLQSLTATSSSELKNNQNLNNPLNIKNINKYDYISNIPQGHPIFSQQNININIKLSSSSTNLKYNKESSKPEKKIWKKKEDKYSNSTSSPSPNNAKYDYPINKKYHQSSSPSLINFSPLDKILVNLEEPNPLEKFVLYPNNLYDIDIAAIYNSIKKNNTTSGRDLVKKNALNDILSLKPCYLLAKIPNWRLVTNFVPGSKLTNEKFEKILPLNGDESKEKEKEIKPGENEENKDMKYSWIYSDKYGEEIEKYLEENISMKKNIKSRIFNEELIISQYQYNTLKLKNNLKQGNFRINYLDAKIENLKNALEENNKDRFNFSESS